MILSKRKFSAGAASVLAAGLVLVGTSFTASGQNGDHDSHWNAPRGYDDQYHENGQANPAARQGYEAGFGQGESDARAHHSFRPTHVDTYKNVPESPSTYKRDDFKRIYREAFVKGYSKGYGR